MMVDFLQSNILDDLDLLGKVKFDSVIDRYYSKYYKHLTPSIISTSLFNHTENMN